MELPSGASSPLTEGSEKEKLLGGGQPGVNPSLYDKRWMSRIYNSCRKALHRPPLKTAPNCRKVNARGAGPPLCPHTSPQHLSDLAGVGGGEERPLEKIKNK